MGVGRDKLTSGCGRRMRHLRFGTQLAVVPKWTFTREASARLEPRVCSAPRDSRGEPLGDYSFSIVEYLSEFRPNQYRLDNVAKRAEWQDVVNDVGYLGVRGIRSFKPMFVMPGAIWANTLFIDEIAKRIDVCDHSQPTKRHSDKRPHAILNHQPCMHGVGKFTQHFEA